MPYKNCYLRAFYNNYQTVINKRNQLNVILYCFTIIVRLAALHYDTAINTRYNDLISNVLNNVACKKKTFNETRKKQTVNQKKNSNSYKPNYFPISHPKKKNKQHLGSINHH